ncbi:MAG: phenylalanine--tRNA ligase subunit alpha [Natronomonas sp.]
MKLPDTQLAVLEGASATDATQVDVLADELDADVVAVIGAAFALEEAGLLDVDERVIESYELTEEGETYRRSNLPEHRLASAALEAGADEEPIPLGEVIETANLDGDAVDIALSNFARKGLGRIENGNVALEVNERGLDPAADPESRALSAIDSGETADLDGTVLERLESRGLVERSEETVRSVRVTDDGVTALMEGIEVAETVGAVTPELLTSGEWRDVDFAEYNVEADAERVDGGSVHVLRQMAERVKEVLVGMGFREMSGPHIDADFWINDCLFMPQDHPARTHWDRFALETPSHIGELPEDLVERVERAHREGVGPDGEGYHSPWDEDFARALALRGHTTSLSTRYLSGEAIGQIEPPARFFSVEKAYRNDTLDATHLLEFFQIEGWVMAEELSVRDLMGTFEEFYAHFGIEDIEFKPHYNPYTEPSFELFGTHPTTDELIEIGNSGLFRPEMLEPLGVECDVMAWGLALERLAMLTTGAEDIRDLHGTLADLEFLRNAEVIY